MRRILLLVIGALALAIAVPGAASAHGRHHGHHRHHHHTHKAQHVRAKHFGVKTHVSDPSRPDAGTVDAFADGTLTIRLTNGATVSGAVDEDTVINCMPAKPTATASHHDEGDDDRGDDDRGQAACDAADLVPGAIVHVAILKLGGDGPEFKLVLLREQEATA